MGYKDRICNPNLCSTWSGVDVLKQFTVSIVFPLIAIIKDIQCRRLCQGVLLIVMNSNYGTVASGVDSWHGAL